MVFRDISWLTERTSLWDALGVASYGLVFAFIESVVLFLAVALLGLFLPVHWHPDRRITFLALLVLMTSAWGMVSQLFFLWDVSLPSPAIQYLRNSDHPLRILYAGALVVVVSTVLSLAAIFVKSKRSVSAMRDIMERISLLTMFYLLFDLLGLVIVVIRNVA